MVLLLIVKDFELLIPPPIELAVLWCTELLFRTRMPELLMPPPCEPKLFVIMLLSTVAPPQ